MKIKFLCQGMLFWSLVAVVAFSVSSCDEAEKKTTEENQTREIQTEVEVTIPIDDASFQKAQTLQNELLEETVENLKKIADPVAHKEETRELLKNATDDKRTIFLIYHSENKIEDLRKVENPVFYYSDLLKELGVMAKNQWDQGQYISAMTIYDLVGEYYPEEKDFNFYQVEYRYIATAYLRAVEMLYTEKKPAQAAKKMYELREEYYDFISVYGEEIGWQWNGDKVSYRSFMEELARQTAELSKDPANYNGLKIDDVLVFGGWEQDGDTSVTDPILWKIVSFIPHDHTKVFQYTLESVYPLAESCWNTTMDPNDPASNYWENSDVRRFLNGDFAYGAFSSEERFLMKENTFRNDFVVTNGANEFLVGTGGKSTSDLVTLYCPYDFYPIQEKEGEYEVYSGTFQEDKNPALRYAIFREVSAPKSFSIKKDTPYLLYPIIEIGNIAGT